MKKLLALLMTLVMIVSCVVCLSVSSSAAELEWLEETYNLQDEMPTFGTHEVNADGSLKGEALFGDGMWTYEYFDPSTGKFGSMQAFYAKQTEGWTFGGWWGSGGSGSQVYIPYAEAATTPGDPAVYCLIGNNGKTLHPGIGYGPVITYIVPCDGVISFDAELFIASGYSSNVSTDRNGGSSVYLYQNDTRLWPASEDEAKMFLDTTPKDSPKEVTYSAFSVKKGDRIRMAVTVSPGTTNASKGVDVGSLPVVTWHSATLPIGNPNGNPPENVMAKKYTENSCKVSWSAAKNAAGYNVYLDGKKVNDSPITELEYEFTGLEANKMYQFTVSTVTTAGRESAQCEPQAFRTKKATVTSTDPIVTPPSISDIVDTPDTNEGSGNTDTVTGPVTDDVTGDTGAGENTESKTSSKKTSSKKTSSKKTTASDDGFPWWIIIVIAGVVVLAVIAVVVFLVLKKKPAEEAAVEGEVAEGEAAEEVSEEAPAEAPEATETPDAPTEE